MRVRGFAAVALVAAATFALTGCAGNLQLQWGGDGESKTAEQPAAPSAEPVMPAEPEPADPEPAPSAVPESRSDGDGCPSHVNLPGEIDPRVCATPSAGDLVPVSGNWHTLAAEDGAGCQGACPVPASGTAFTSPGGNLGCLESQREGSEFECVIGGIRFDTSTVRGGDRSVPFAWIVFGASQPVSGAGAPGPESAGMLVTENQTPDATTLEFTQVAQVGATSYCVMQYFGLTCWDTASDEGFLISRDQWISWNAHDVWAAGSCETCGKYHADGTPK
ncbi:MAG: hypothetical protein ACK5LO_09715 [Leucobacter sp.]